MNPQSWTRSLGIAALTALAVIMGMASDAEGACFNSPSVKRLTTSPASGPGSAPALLLNPPGIATQGSSSQSGPIVGLWHTVFTAVAPPSPPELAGVFDTAFQQFHDDGTEMMVSKGVRPELGNICVGVWKRRSNGTIQLHHVTWNWTGLPGSQNVSTGVFVLDVTLRTNTRGTAFSGRWKAASYDTVDSDVPQAGSELAGTVTAERIYVD